MKKVLKETQTLHTGCSKMDPQHFAPLQTPFPGTQDGQNLISFTYKPSFVKIDAHNFELSWQQTHTQTHKQTDRANYNTLCRSWRAV